ncbi:MAG: isoaspartyl peptidase/L-asparaginase [Candidatus Promineofilum sp.]|nr:isoaspartyl peptidase/L-asparaginase [Promineifilum sp.]
MTIAIIVHGGAGGWAGTGADLAQARQACEQAAAAGQKVLARGGSALDAVEAAVVILEDCPVLDAGRGSYPNAEGFIEMDALIMDGRTLNLGAIAAIQRVRHPVTLARRVMLESGHNFLVGPGADAFADSIAFPRCEVGELLVDKGPEQAKVAPEALSTLGDTVGAVALDAHGNVAAATSTGGTPNKRPGRVGDSPLVGSGAYADNWTAAVSATGYGEALMRVVISKRVCDLVGAGLSAAAACDAAIRLLEERTGGEGGLIAVDARGQIGWAYNTGAMPHAYAIGDGPVVVGQ